jgi:DNA ligase-1
VAYDLLEHQGTDLRQHPLQQRRALLERLHQSCLQHPETGGSGQLRLSATQTLQSWSELNEVRDQARAQRAEGLMLKALDSPYLVGRKRGHWWKHKLEPLRLDAVLLYAQAGSGKRANLYTDYSLQVFELAFEGIQASKRHKCGFAVRFPRISRWRTDKPASEADSLASARALMAQLI